MKDQFGRTIDYLRVSVTDRCNLRCQYCMPPEGVEKKAHEQMLTLEEMALIIRAFMELGVTKVRLTGGEPLVKKGLLNLIRQLRAPGLLKELVLTTNGQLLSGQAEALAQAGVDRINLSLDTLRADRYEAITRGGRLEEVWEGVKAAQAAGLRPLKINTVLIGGFNDDEIEAFVALADAHPWDVRFIELMPIGQVAGWSKERFLDSETVLKRVPDLLPVARNEADQSSPATYYHRPGALGRVGLIRPLTCKFCQDCNRVRLTADGKLKLCLHSDAELDLKTFLREQPDHGEEALIRALVQEIQKNIFEKPWEHQLEDGGSIQRNMVQIGG